MTDEERGSEYLHQKEKLKDEIKLEYERKRADIEAVYNRLQEIHNEAYKKFGRKMFISNVLDVLIKLAMYTAAFAVADMIIRNYLK